MLEYMERAEKLKDSIKKRKEGIFKNMFSVQICYTAGLVIGSRIASFKRPSFSVNVSVCVQL